METKRVELPDCPKELLVGHILKLQLPCQQSTLLIGAASPGVRVLLPWLVCENSHESFNSGIFAGRAVDLTLVFKWKFFCLCKT